MRLLAGPGRSLRAAIEASWRLLSTEERSALTVACAFHGPFDVEVGEAAFRDRGVADPLGTLQSLRERSLLQAAYGKPGERRLRVYDTVRAFVAEAVTVDERRRGGRAVSAAMGELAERCLTDAWGPLGTASLREMLAEEANLAGALDALDHVDAKPHVVPKSMST